MEPVSTQERIILSMSLIGLLSNDLNIVNIQMASLPIDGVYAKQFQQEREQYLSSVADRLAVIAEEIADFMNSADAVDESIISVADPIIQLIQPNETPLNEGGDNG